MMGILNVTPDSFFDGGRFWKDATVDVSAVLEEAGQMIVDGADILDIGGESSGPDSKDVPLKEELSRVLPVIEVLRKRYPDVFLSVDTYKSEVARQAIALGADIVNDVTALRGDCTMASVLAMSGKYIVLMYSKDPTARTTRTIVHYHDVVQHIFDFFEERLRFAFAHRIKPEQIILDPGLGFFVSGEPRYSFEILKRLEVFYDLGFPLLLGPSRKSFLGGRIHDRLQGTLDFCSVAVRQGVKILRVHDVKPVKQYCEKSS